jgi:hypothetical protein
MSNINRIVFFFFILNCEISAQECYLKVERVVQDKLQKYNIKEVKVFQGKENEKLLHHFFINSSGCPIKHLHFDRFSETSGLLIKEVVISNYISIITEGRQKENGKFTLYKKVVLQHTPGNKLLKKETEERHELLKYTNEFFDTSDSNKINLLKWIIHAETNDTLQMIRHVKDLKKEERLIMEKDSGHWRETEKSITTFDKKGKFIEYWLYKNEKLHTNYTSKSLEKDKSYDSMLLDKDYNPLPAGEPPVDTIYTNDENPEIAFQESNSGKYMAIIFYKSTDRKKISHINLYYRKCGLCFKHLFLDNPVTNERYEYLFRAN